MINMTLPSTDIFHHQNDSYQPTSTSSFVPQELYSHQHNFHPQMSYNTLDSHADYHIHS